MNNFHFMIRELVGWLPFHLVGLGFYAATVILLAKRIQLKKSHLFLFPVFSIYFGLVFANIFGVFLNGSDSVLVTSDDSFLIIIFEAFFYFWKGTKVLYGGYFGSIIGVFVFCKVFHKEASTSTLLDISSIGISLLFTFWRLSCFTGGCCYGIQSDLFGINFAKYSSAYVHLMNTAFILPDGSATVPLIPTQLISSGANFLIFIFLLLTFLRNSRKPLYIFFMHMLLYGGFRFTIEFFRMDPREFWGPLSISQWIFVFMLPVIVWFFCRNKVKRNK